MSLWLEKEPDVPEVIEELENFHTEAYEALCRPQFGRKSFGAILTYIQDVKQYAAHVTISIVRCIPDSAVQRCGQIAASLGVEFKVR